MAEVWAPGLDDVARHIPSRTRDTKTPGSDALLGTFTAHTTPDSGQAQAAIDGAVLAVLSRTGPLDSTAPALLDQARVAAEWRAAADIELAYPQREADVRVYDQLDARAKYELDTLMARLSEMGEGPVAESVPYWSAPDPPAYADADPGDYRLAYGRYYWGGVDRGPILGVAADDLSRLKADKTLYGLIAVSEGQAAGAQGVERAGRGVLQPPHLGVVALLALVRVKVLIFRAFLPVHDLGEQVKVDPLAPGEDVDAVVAFQRGPRVGEQVGGAEGLVDLAPGQAAFGGADDLVTAGAVLVGGQDGGPHGVQGLPVGAPDGGGSDRGVVDPFDCRGDLL